MYRADRSPDAFQPAEGWCMAASEHEVQHYGRYIARIALDLSALVIEECEGYDHDKDHTPADSRAFRAAAAARGVDVLRYHDEDCRGQSLTCYRLVSERAVAACSVVEVVDSRDV